MITDVQYGELGDTAIDQPAQISSIDGSTKLSDSIKNLAFMKGTRTEQVQTDGSSPDDIHISRTSSDSNNIKIKVTENSKNDGSGDDAESLNQEGDGFISF